MIAKQTRMFLQNVLICLVIMCPSGVFGFESIDEALKNGVSKGDVILYGNYISTQKGTNTSVGNTGFGVSNYGYLGNVGYLMGSVGLSYTSGFYKNLRAAIGFRAAAPFYNAHSKQYFPSGRGDMKVDFFNQNQAAIAESFIEYFDGDTSIKGGRIAISNDWINTLGDGFWIRNRSIENLLLEMFWVHDFGRIDYYQMTTFNYASHIGLYNVGAKYYILDDKLTAKVYTYFAPPIFTAIGARVDGKIDISKFELSGYVGYAYSIEHNNRMQSIDTINTHKDGNVFYAHLAFGRANVFDVALGYIHTGKQSGWGSLGIMGDNISPFFVWGGRVLRTQANANSFYALARAKFERFNLSLVYGTTSYNTLGVNRVGAYQNELNATVEIGFTKNVIGVLNILNTHLDSASIPTMTQINGGLRLSF